METSTATDSPTSAAIARETGFTHDAVASMMRSITRGGGRMAQFDHPEFGGAGQWMRGGMLMIGDFANHDLHARVARLCEAVAEAVASRPSREATGFIQRQTQAVGDAAHFDDQRAAGAWWPASLGVPDTSGLQDGMRYAWFADARRLVIDRDGVLTTYDTGDHRIAGVSQQQGARRTLEFASQGGPVDLADLPVVGPPTEPGAKAKVDGQQPSPVATTRSQVGSNLDPLQAIEMLAALHARGVLTDEEFAKKKEELLARI
jgi:hypothetical protein